MWLRNAVKTKRVFLPFPTENGTIIGSDTGGYSTEWIMESPESGILKTVRGGSWFSNRRHFQLDYRRTEHPAWGLMDVGLRIVREVVQQKRRENKQ